MAPDPNELNDKSSIFIVRFFFTALASNIAPFARILFQCN